MKEKIPFNNNLKQNATKLRKAGNLSEVLLWLQLKKKQINGFSFDRQHIIGSYITDFYCAEARLVLEIDGGSHDFKVEYDEKREKYLQSVGLTVIHILDIDIRRNLDNVVFMLRDHPLLTRR